MSLTVMLLAAGKGSRMFSQTPKVLHRLAGRSFLSRLLDTVSLLAPETTVVIYHQEVVKQTSTEGFPCLWVKQEKQLGTGDAVKCGIAALPFLKNDSPVLILCGDTPLVSESTLQELLSLKTEVKILGATLEDPSGYGRLVCDDQARLSRIIEEKEASKEEKKICKVNSGCMVIPYGLLKEYLPKLELRNSGEVYLTDLITLLFKKGVSLGVHFAKEPMEIQGINNQLQLSYAEAWFQKHQAEQLMLKGLHIVDFNRFELRGKIAFGEDVVIEADVLLEGEISLGSGTVVGKGCCLKEVKTGENVTIKPYSVLEKTVIEDNCSVGPFAHLRLGSYLRRGSKVGNFVELKQCELGVGSKANHLTYLGDTMVGSEVNIGAGTITCNYDGVNKFKTQIGDKCFIGSNVSLVAPVTIEKKAKIGAGSVITRSVPSEHLALGRGRQVNLKRRKGEGEKL